MKPAAASARVLVASDHVDDATQIVNQLKPEFAEISASTDIDSAVDDYDAFEPDVLVVAFDSLEKAQAHMLRLHRLSQKTSHDGHRTVLLCHKDEVRGAFDLCKQGVFDDYVLHWPHAQDGLRLAMSVWSAARQTVAAPVEGPSNLDLINHVRQIGVMQSMLKQQVAAADFESGSAQQLRARLAPQLDSMLVLADKVKQIQPVVLIVEDDDFARKLLQKALDGTGYEVLFAPDGAAALGLLRRVRPDLILMDINLPGIDGVALTQKLKSQPALAAIPVLMLTGEARRETLESSMNAGAVGFIVKPFVRDALIAKLERFLSTGA